MNNIPYDGSLCWNCKKASGGLGCPFVDEKPSGSVPIKGWTARKKHVQNSPPNSSHLEKIYVVQDCPLFEEG